MQKLKIKHVKIFFALKREESESRLLTLSKPDSMATGVSLKRELREQTVFNQLLELIRLCPTGEQCQLYKIFGIFI